MKNLFTLTISLVVGLSAAQAQTNIPPANQLHQQTIGRLLARQKEQSAQKTTGMQQRLIAQQHTSVVSQAPDRMDSVHYYYTATNRGSAFDLSLMYYDLCSGDNPFFLPESVQADSAGLWPGGSTAAQPYCWRVCAYTPTHDLASFTGFIDVPAGPDVAVNMVYSYNAQNQCTGTLSQHSDILPPVWEDYVRHFFASNAQGNILLDSAELYNDTFSTWQPLRRTVYIYDASGTDPLEIRYDETATAGGSFFPQSRAVCTYYPDHRLRTLRWDMATGPSVCSPSIIDSFGYTGSNSFFDYRLSGYFDASGNRVPYRLDVRHLNAQNLPDTLTLIQKNAAQQWDTMQQQYCSYNTYANPMQLQTYLFSNGTSGFDNRYDFYYETYSNAVYNIAATARDIQLYPNPAGSTLNICWRSAGTRTPVSVSVTAMNGQMVYAETRQWAQAVQQLSIGHLQPGMYQLTISGQDGKMLYHGSFVKE